jgi:hypothetical protein
LFETTLTPFLHCSERVASALATSLRRRGATVVCVATAVDDAGIVVDDDNDDNDDDDDKNNNHNVDVDVVDKDDACTGLVAHVFRVSHVGGHRHAGNVISFDYASTLATDTATATATDTVTATATTTATATGAATATVTARNASIADADDYDDDLHALVAATTATRHLGSAGDWYGRIQSDEDAHTLTEHVLRGRVWWQRWRGRTDVSRRDAKRLGAARGLKPAVVAATDDATNGGAERSCC